MQYRTKSLEDTILRKIHRVMSFIILFLFHFSRNVINTDFWMNHHHKMTDFMAALFFPFK